MPMEHEWRDLIYCSFNHCLNCQEGLVSFLKESAPFKLSGYLENANRDVDYRDIMLSNWDLLIGALRNWEAKGKIPRSVYTPIA